MKHKPARLRRLPRSRCAGRGTAAALRGGPCSVPLTMPYQRLHQRLHQRLNQPTVLRELAEPNNPELYV